MEARCAYMCWQAKSTSVLLFVVQAAHGSLDVLLYSVLEFFQVLNSNTEGSEVYVHIVL